MKQNFSQTLSGKDKPMRLTALLILATTLYCAAETAPIAPAQEDVNVFIEETPLGEMQGEHMQERMLDAIERQDPEKAKQLRELREKDPDAFAAEINNRRMGVMRGNSRHQGGPEIPPEADRMESMHGRGGNMRNAVKERFTMRNDEFLAWLEENYPTVAKQLREAFENNPETAFMDTMHIAGKYRALFETAKRNPELANLMRMDDQLKQRREELLKNYSAGKIKRKDVLAELEEVVSARFDIIIEKRRMRFDELKARLEELQKEIEKQQKDLETLSRERDAQIKKRVDELTAENGKKEISWD